MQKKRLFAAWLAAGMLLGGAISAAEEEETPTMTAYVNVEAGTCLNIRRNPRIGSEILYRVERGDSLTVTEEKDGWCWVKAGEDGGWCLGKYLSSTEVGAEDATESSEKSYTVAADGRVAVREAPGGKRVGWLHPGDTVTVSGIRADLDGVEWAIVAKGYINAEFLKEAAE